MKWAFFWSHGNARLKGARKWELWGSTTTLGVIQLLSRLWFPCNCLHIVWGADKRLSNLASSHHQDSKPPKELINRKQEACCTCTWLPWLWFFCSASSHKINVNNSRGYQDWLSLLFWELFFPRDRIGLCQAYYDYHVKCYYCYTTKLWQKDSSRN